MTTNKTIVNLTIREMIDNFQPDKLKLTAFKEKKDGSYHSLSYGELRNNVKALALALRKTGVKKGNKIGLLAENRIEWALAYLATTYIGAVIVPLDIFLSSPELVPILKKVEAKALFCSQKYLRKIIPLENRVETLERIICFDPREEVVRQAESTSSDKSASKKFDYIYLDSFIQRGKELSKKTKVRPPKPAPDDSAALIFMEGERLVELSHKNIVSNGYSFLKTMNYPQAPGEKIIAQLPLHHTYPAIFGFIIPLLSYSETTFIAGVKNKLVFQTAKEVSANCITLVPLTLEKLYLGLYERLKKETDGWRGFSNFETVNDFFDHLSKEKKGRLLVEKAKKDLGLDQIKCLLLGGSPLSPWLVSGMEKLGIQVLDGYGLSETSPVATYNTFQARRSGSIGRPLVGVEVKIDNPDRAGEGEILVKGPNVTRGYYNMPEETGRAIDAEGRLHTGDWGRIDEDGFVYITGRLKDVIINKGGKNIYPREIEKKLLKSPYFAATVVKPSVDETGGEYPKAFVRLDDRALSSLERKTDKKFSGEDIKKLARKELTETLKDLAAYKIPRDFEIVESEEKLEEIKNRLFKIPEFLPLATDSAIVKAMDKSEAKAFKQKREFFERTELIGALKEEAAAISTVAPSEIDRDSSFLELFDSVQLTELVERLENKFKLSLSPALLFEHTSLGELSVYLNGQLEKSLKERPKEPSQDETEIPGKSGSEQSAGKEEIAVIGMACVFPGSDNPDEFWSRLEKGDNLVSEIPKERFNWEDYRKEASFRWGGFINDIDKFDAAFFNISPREAELMDPQQRIFLQIVWQAIEDAGLKASELTGTNTGIFAGVSTHDYTELQDGSHYPVEAHTSTGWSHSILPNRVSYLLNFKGPSESIDTACSSSLVALRRAVQSIRTGECRLAIAGGVNALLNPKLFISFAKAGMLSPDGQCKTFDKEANGYVRGEGAGAVLLKPLTEALKDGDRIYGIIKGSAVNHGGKASSLTAPNPEAQARLLLSAYEEAGVPPQSVGYIECHGTGTTLGDPVEVEGLKKAFDKLYQNQGLNSPSRPHCGLGSVKTNIGHLEMAAGIAGVIKTLLSFKHKKLPATLNFKELNPYIKLDRTPFYIVEQTEDWRRLKDKSGQDFPLRAGVSSFGFGGANAHVVLEEYRTEAVPVEFTFPCLIILSAKNEDRLKSYAKNLIRFLEKSGDKISIADLAYTLQVGREAMEERLALLTNDKKELLAKLEKYLKTGGETSGLYLGAVDKNSSNSQLLADDEEGAEFLNSIIQKKKLGKLARLWVGGAGINWDLLYGETKPRRISSPTYPFAKRRCWINSASIQKSVRAEKTMSSNFDAAKKIRLRSAEKQFFDTKDKLPDFKELKTPSGKMALKSVFEKSPDTSVISENFAEEESLSRSGEKTHQNIPSVSVVRETVKKELADVCLLEIGEINDNRPFTDLGVDSILAVEFADRLAKMFEIDLPTARLYDYPSVDSLGAYLASALKDKKSDLRGPVKSTVIMESAALGYKKLKTSLKAPLSKNDDKKVSNQKERIFETTKALSANAVKPQASIDAVEQDVAVIGISARFPDAADTDELWRNLAAGKDSVIEIPPERWDWRQYYDSDPKAPDKTYSKWGAFLDDIDKFDPLFFNISPAEAEHMDPQQRIFLEESWKALEDAGYSASALSGVKCGVYVGVMNSEYAELLNRAGSRQNPSSAMTGNANSILAARIAYFMNLKGAALAIDTACSSSLVAIHLACQSLLKGESDMALAGGVTLYLSHEGYIKMSKAGMLSFEGKCKTFDDQADGFVPGEGAGVVVLKPLKKAMADGDNIHGVIKGSGVNQDGASNGITAPSAESQRKLELEVYRKSGVNPETVTYVETHGTGTKLGDPIEIDALKGSFGAYTQKRQYCAVGSVKTNIGHTSAAAGAAGVIKVLLAMKHKKIPPSLNFKVPNRHINFKKSPFYVNSELSDWSPEDGLRRRAAVSSFGFSGTNAHMILEERRPDTSSPPDFSPPYLIVLSAKNEERLKEIAKNLLRFLEDAEEVLFANLAYTLQIGREAMEERLTLLVEDRKELLSKLAGYLKTGRETSGLYFGNVKKDGSKNMLLVGGESGELFLQSVIKNKELERLAQLWTNGVEIDWDLLYGENKPRRISLPTYPFAKERHWIESKKLPAAQVGAAALHPLLDSNVSDLQEQAFVKELRKNQFYLKDHRVKEEMILPGAAYIEMARAAGELSNKKERTAGIKNIVWTRPLKVGNEPQKVKIVLYPENEKLFWLASGAESGEIIYSQGEIEYEANSPDKFPALDIESLQKRCSESKSKEECYQMFEKAGLSYGPAFQVIESLRYNESEALARLKLPDFLSSGFEEFGLHPSLLDGALQTVAGLSVSEKETFLPFSLRELSIIRPLKREIYAYATIAPDSNSQAKSFDIKLLDMKGELLATLDKFSVRAIQSAALKEKVFEPVEIPVVKPTSTLKEPKTKDLGDKLRDDLTGMASAILKVEKDQIDPDENISEYGFDSISFTELTNRINEKFALELNPPEMFDHPSMDSLKDYLLEKRQDIFLDFYQSPLEVEDKTEEIKSDEAGSQAPAFKSRFAAFKPALSVVRASDAIAVIGMAARFPGASDLREFWKNLTTGKDCVGEIPSERWDWRRCGNEDEFCSKWGGFLDDVDKFDADFFNISPREAELMDPQQRIFLEVIWETLEDAGYRASELKGGAIGLFAGVSGSTYYSLLQREGAASEAHAPTGIAPSVLVNRISYIFDWHGPSEAVDTACSSSLVALDRALQTLKNGDCELAAVGGVNLMLTPELHRSFSRAGMLSEDGRCKTFDESADGYVRGEGAGAILLKPLDQALKDNDRIYGVIKGSSVNHGGRVSSLTAPNPSAQAELVVKAHQRAGTLVESVGYIECHGTGTSLGDPIEINGLKKAFSELCREQGMEAPTEAYCALGSVKTNIGHLEAAAGIAGVIKTLLAIQHKKLPANLHFEKLNPYIELESAPFYVAAELQEWRPLKDKSGADFPLRAGVSSFGFGGANAHVVLEEYPSRIIRTEFLPPYLIILSAKDKDRLAAYSEKLIRFLEESNQKVSMADLAYTMQIGREAMEERLALSANDKRELLGKLKEYLKTGRETSGLYLGNLKSKKVETDLLISGVSGKRFIEAALEHKEIDKLALLWVGGAAIDWGLLYGENKPRRISPPTYPFAKERHWIEEKGSLNVEFKNQDSSVFPYAGLHPLIDRNTSTLKEYSFQKELRENLCYLKDHQIKGEKILPGAASMEMIRAAAELVDGQKTVHKLKNLIWNQPIKANTRPQKIKVVLHPENERLAWEIASVENERKIIYSKGYLHYLFKEENRNFSAVDLEKIKKRCSQTKNKADCYDDFKRLGFEYGPAFQTLESLSYNKDEALARLKLPDFLNSEFDCFGLHPSLMDGALQTVSALSRNEGEETIFLPFGLKEAEILKPLEKEIYAYAVSNNNTDNSQIKSFDIKLLNNNGEVLVSLKDFSLKALRLKTKTNKNASGPQNIFFEPIWKPSPIQDEEGEFTGRILIFDADKSLFELFKRKYPKAEAILARSGDKYLKEETGYQVGKFSEDDYQRLFGELTKDDRLPTVILGVSQPRAENLFQNSFYSIFHPAKALMKSKAMGKIRFLYLYQNNLKDSYCDQAVSGLAKTATLEQPRFFFQTLGVGDLSDKRDVLNKVVKELQLSPQTHEVEYYGEERRIKVFKEFNQQNFTSSQSLLKKRGVYLITGGLGGLGMIMARYLADKYQARLILAGRSMLSADKEKRLLNLNKSGAEAIYISADISRLEEVEKLVAKSKEKFKEINGLIHSAGVIKDSLMANKTKSEIEAVFPPKILGALNLDRVLKEEKLDLMVFFSSTAGILGNPGQADYAYANAFLDNFAARRDRLTTDGRRFGKTVSINWPYWAEGGMRLDETTLKWLENSKGVSPLPTKEGIKIFEAVLASGKTPALALRGATDKIRSELLNKKTRTALPEVEKGPRAYSDLDGGLEKIQIKLTNIISDILKIDKESLDPDESMEMYGMDSIMLASMTRQIEKLLKVEISPSEIIEHQDIHSLSLFIFESLQGKKNSEGSDELDLNKEIFLDENINRKDIALTQAAEEPNSIFLTGATGFLGAYLLRELLSQTKADIHCLVRADDIDKCGRRLEDNLKFYKLWSSSFKQRIIPLPGDISQPLLGLSEKKFGWLAMEADVIYHNAAIVDFVRSYSALKATNVFSVHEILKLAAAKKEKPIHFISSITAFESDYFAGKTIFEADAPTHFEGMTMGYGQTKLVAEGILNLASKRGIRSAIYRPGEIHGDSRNGICNLEEISSRVISSRSKVF